MRKKEAIGSSHAVDYDHPNFICIPRHAVRHWSRVLAWQKDSAHQQVGIAQDRADKLELKLSFVGHIKYLD